MPALVAIFLLGAVDPAFPETPVAQPSHETPRWQALKDSVFYNHGAPEGLPHGAVSAIGQDGRGFIWLVTTDGLMRWDGHQFLPLRSGLDDVDRDTRVLKADDEGILWLGTGRGLVRFEPRLGEFRRVEVLEEAGVSGLLDLDFEGDRLWLAGEHGLAALVPDTGEVQSFELGADSGRFFDVLAARDGSLFLGTERGLFHRASGQSGFQRLTLGPAEPVRVDALLEAEDGSIWIATARHGVFEYRASGAIRSHSIPDFSDAWIYALAEVKPGVLWLGTFGQGIIELQPGQGTVRRLRHERLLGHSLAHDNVWTLFRDRSGLLWVGTGKGMSLHDPGADALSSIFGDSGREAGLRDQRVTAVLATTEDTLWLGLGEAGVDVLDPAAGRIDTIDPDPTRPQSALPGGAVEALVQASDGSVFIGSNWGIYQRRGRELRRLELAPDPVDGYVSSLRPHAGALWVGGTAGLWRLDGELRPERAIRFDALKERMSDPRITVIHGLSDGALLLGTWNGLNWIDGAGRLTARIPGAGASGSPFANDFITSIVRDRRDQLWIGTAGGGLYIAHRADRPARYQHLGRAQGLPSDIVVSLLVDGQDRIWAATNAGLAVIDGHERRVIARLGPRQGALMTPYLRKSAARNAAGELAFGGEGGLTLVHPERWQPREYPAPLALMNIRVSGRSVPAPGPDEAMPLRVPAEDSAIAVEFAALDYVDPAGRRYRYRLEGFESRWHEADADHRSAVYTGLPAGAYELRIESSDRLGRWQGARRSLRILVEPHWYETTGFGVALLLALALFTFGLVRWRTDRLLRRQQFLEQRVRDRTQALREKSEALEKASVTDPLTGMYNRRFLDQYLGPDVALALRRYRDSDEAGALREADLLFFLVDLDFFKQVNDDYGHQAGDRVLIEMRPRLLEVFRETDYLVRWGGEEFLVIARGSSRRHAPELAERIRRHISDHPFELDGGESVLKTCSVGCVPFPFDPAAPQALDWRDCIELADRALYTAKRSGRDAWVWIEAGATPASGELMARLKIDPERCLEDGLIRLTSNRERERLRNEWSKQHHRG